MRFVRGAILCWLVAELPAVAAPWDKPGRQLTFQDEFDGTDVDAGKWVYQIDYVRAYTRLPDGKVTDAGLATGGMTGIGMTGNGGVVSTGGTTSTGGAGGNATTASGSNGCSCNVAGRRSKAAMPVVALLLASLLLQGSTRENRRRPRR